MAVGRGCPVTVGVATGVGAMIANVFFFFQAEDGIRDYKVTGVQTCALPISRANRRPAAAAGAAPPGHRAATRLGASWPAPCPDPDGATGPRRRSRPAAARAEIGRASWRERG